MRPNQSQGVKQLLYDARSYANKFHHRFIHTEYLLLGLLKQSNSATVILNDHGYNCRKLSDICKKRCQKGHHDLEENLKLTPRAQYVMALAGEQMLDLGHENMDSRHVLLGLLIEEEGLGGRVLREAGLTSDKVRKFIIDDPIDSSDKLSPDPASTSTKQVSSKPINSLWRMLCRT